MSFSVHPFRQQLETSLQSASQASDSYHKRLQNILWVKNLDRRGLEYRSMEKRIPVLTTTASEKLYIQYPGKESRPSSHRPSRPWDFRPKLLREGTRPGPDLTFQEIWDVLFEKLEPLFPGHSPHELSEPELPRALATLFYRMAFMLDHRIEQASTYPVTSILYGPERVAGGDEELLGAKWSYHPPMEVVNEISQVVPLWGGISLEAFLQYNDLLAWNEDCKYYYRKTEERHETGWIYETGRVNTILTHVRIIGLITGDVKHSTLLSGFSRGRGVSPAQGDETTRICAPFVEH